MHGELHAWRPSREHASLPMLHLAAGMPTMEDAYDLLAFKLQLARLRGSSSQRKSVSLSVTDLTSAEWCGLQVRMQHALPGVPCRCAKPMHPRERCVSPCAPMPQRVNADCPNPQYPPCSLRTRQPLACPRPGQCKWSRAAPCTRPSVSGHTQGVFRSAPAHEHAGTANPSNSSSSCHGMAARWFQAHWVLPLFPL